MPLTEQIEYTQTILDNAFALHGDIVADDSTQELLDQAEAELLLAQAALDEAKAALQENPPDTVTAKAKLAESLDHTAKAVSLIKEAMEAN